jgi:class 3 adenylate cyclase
MSKDSRHTMIMFTDIVGYTALMGSDEDRVFEVRFQNCQNLQMINKKCNEGP